MKGIFYRLAHYKILEKIDRTLWWESYAGFAGTKSGRCFIESNVLFLEPAIDVNESGFLIMEYNEALDALPQWTKTPYYCTNYTLRSCHNDKIPHNESIGKGLKKRTKEVTIASESEQIDSDIDKSMGSGEIKASVYQLGRYKIIEAESGELRWNTCTHSARLKVGRGFIEGKILFVNGKIIAESEFSKLKFFNRLNQLPKWNKTEYYCTNYSLKTCKSGKIPSEIKISDHVREPFKRIQNKVRQKKIKTVPDDSNKVSDAMVMSKAAGNWSLKLIVVMVSFLVLIIDFFSLFCQISKKYINKMLHHLFFGKNR